MTSVPDQARLARGRVIAATPGAVIRFDNYHYKVRSQSAGGQGVNITPCPHYDVQLALHVALHVSRFLPPAQDL